VRIVLGQQWPRKCDRPAALLAMSFWFSALVAERRIQEQKRFDEP
jgi:hypothetical protein